MFAFVVRRLIGLVAVLFAITVLTFLIFFATPGVDPSRQFAGRNPDPTTVAHIKHQFGLDRPLPVQYVLMMKRLFISRDLVSYGNQALKVVPAILDAAPVTFSLVFGAAILWVIGSIALGLLMVTFKGTFVDPLLMILALIGISMPVFWLGEVVNLITQDRLHDTFLFSWVPPLGYTPFTQDPWQWFLHLIFPWITLSILYIGFYARVLRADLLQVQNEDFVRTAKAKGLSPRGVLVRHMLRTSLITFVSLFGLDFGVLVGGGALLTEVVFGLPGVGLLTYNALKSLDLPVIMATVIYGAFFITIMSALVDIVYARLDPRIRPRVVELRVCTRRGGARARRARRERRAGHAGARGRAAGGRVGPGRLGADPHRVRLPGLDPRGRARRRARRRVAGPAARRRPGRRGPRLPRHAVRVGRADRHAGSTAPGSCTWATGVSRGSSRVTRTSRRRRRKPSRRPT